MDRTCLDCGQTRPHKARGLCVPCYQSRLAAGTLTERPLSRDPASGGLAAAPLVEGITYRQMDYWTRKGFLRASNPRPGSGVWRSWPESERAVARLMARLVRAGLAVDAAHRVARGEQVLAPGIRVVVDDTFVEGEAS